MKKRSKMRSRRREKIGIRGIFKVEWFVASSTKDMVTTKEKREVKRTAEKKMPRQEACEERRRNHARSY